MDTIHNAEVTNMNFSEAFFEGFVSHWKEERTLPFRIVFALFVFVKNRPRTTHEKTMLENIFAIVTWTIEEGDPLTSHDFYMFIGVVVAGTLQLLYEAFKFTMMARIGLARERISQFQAWVDMCLLPLLSWR